MLTVGLPVQHPLGPDAQHQTDAQLAMRAPETGVAQGRLDAPVRQLIERMAAPRNVSIVAIRRAQRLSELRGDPAGIVVRRKPRHQRHARPAGQQVRLDLRELAAERRRGPDARDPDRFSRVHIASSWAVSTGQPARCAAARAHRSRSSRGNRSRLANNWLCQPTSRSSGDATDGVARSERPPGPPAALPLARTHQGQSQGPAFADMRGVLPPGSGTSSGDQPDKTSHTPGTTPVDQPGQSRQESFGHGVQAAADPQVRSVRPQRQADRSRWGMEGEMRDQVRRRAPHTLRHEAAQGDGEAGPAQIPRRGHDTPVAESLRARAHGLDRREDRRRPGDRLLVGIAKQRRRTRDPSPPVPAPVVGAVPARRPATSGTDAIPPHSPASVSSADAARHSTSIIRSIV